jgi:hypothetical protein
MYVNEINPTGAYGEPAAALLLGVSETKLAKARRLGYLEFRRVGTSGRSRIVYGGSWLLEWLAAREDRQSDRVSDTPRLSAG